MAITSKRLFCCWLGSLAVAVAVTYRAMLPPMVPPPETRYRAIERVVNVTVGCEEEGTVALRVTDDTGLQAVYAFTPHECHRIAECLNTVAWGEAKEKVAVKPNGRMDWTQ